MPRPLPTYTNLTMPLYYPNYSNYGVPNFSSFTMMPSNFNSYSLNSMYTPYNYSSFPNYSLTNYGLNSFSAPTSSYFPSYVPSSLYGSNYGSSYTPTAPTAFRLGSSTSLSDRYGVNDRVPIRTASTQQTYDDGGGRQEVIASNAATSDYAGGDRIAMASGGGQSPATYRTVVTTPSTGAHAPRTVTKPVGRRVTPATKDELKTQAAPIWKPFMQRFKACVPNCEPTGYTTWGGRENASCHPQGLAVDVKGMYCSDDGRHYSALDRWDRFQTMVECMKTQMRFYRVHPNGKREIVVGVLYRQHRGRGPTKDHHDHVHMSLGCYDGWVY